MEEPNETEYATGLLVDTEAEATWKEENLVETIDVELNELGLERLAEEPSSASSLLLAASSEGDLATEALLGSSDLPTAVDNSELQYFPGIRSQGSLGSCVSFAVTYYTMTYMTAMARGWDASDPTDNTTKFSPKWTYNMVNGGMDGGSYLSSTVNVLMDHGAATWADVPYNSNYQEWVYDDSDVWVDALNYRIGETGYVSDVDGAGQETAKTLLANGYVLNFATYIYCWQYGTISDDPSTTADDSEVGKQAAYWVNGDTGGHMMTIVGYNDDIWVDINGNGEVEEAEKGAFRIANSWGTGWKDGGFTWLSYDALNAVSEAGGPSTNREEAIDLCEVYWLTAEESYTPTLVAVFTVEHSERSQMQLSVGKAESGTTPEMTWTPTGLTGDGGNYGFDGVAYSDSSLAPAGTFALDLTDLSPDFGTASTYFLGLNDTTDATVEGTITSFTLTDGLGNVIASASDVPQTDGDDSSTTVYASVTSELTDFVVDASWTSVEEGSTTSIQVKLAAEPVSDVTVTANWLSGDSDLAVSSGSTLVFTSSNWDTYQAIEVSAGQDADDLNGLATLQIAASGLLSMPVRVQEVDDELIYVALLNEEPGWTYEGDWAWGVPEGGGGSHGYPDPTSASTGLNVIGDNLAGDYAANTSTAWVTTSAIDCSGYGDVELRFERWLNIQRSAYDHAYLQASNDGVTWTEIWSNSSLLTDDFWTLVSYDISDVAYDEETVYIRWGLSSNSTWQYSGWNIDDVVLAGTALEPAGDAPTSVDLVSAYDTGVSDSDNSTYFDNSSTDEVLQFDVTGTIAGATVKVYADGIAIGTAIAAGETTTVTTNGTYDLADGAHTITACQAELGKRKSPQTPELTITVDSAVTLPDVVDPVPNARTTAVDSIEITLSEPVTGMDLSDLSLMLDGTPLDLSDATLTPNSGEGYATSFILGNLTTITEATGSYELTVSAADTEIIDEAGNVLVANASGAWARYDLVMEGTSGDDIVVVTTDGTNHTAEINGVTVWAVAACQTFYFNGGGGTDRIDVYGSDSPDVLVSGPDVSTLDWGSDGVNLTIVDFDRLYAYGGADDTAEMTGDASGGNRFYAYPVYSIVSNAVSVNRATGFGTVTALPGGGTDNRAYFYDATGADVLTATSTDATQTWASGEVATASGFERVYAYGSAGDTAEITGDSVGGNRMYAYETHTIVTTASSFIQASGFDSVTTTAGGTTDNRAYLYGGSGVDDLAVTPDSATMDWSTGVSALAQDFARVYAYGSAGDNATLSGDSAGGNRFYGYDTRSIYATASSYAQASGFDMVTATAGGTTDNRAYLYGGSGIDDLSVTPTSSTMDWGTGVSAVVDDFGRIYAEGTTEDNATITGDGAGDARFYGYDTRSIYLTSSFFVQTSDFGAVTANPNGGTGNKAYLYDDVAADSVTLLPTVAMRNWASGTVATAESFEKVYAYGSAGDTANLTGDGAGGNRLYAYDTSSILTRSSSTAQVSGFDDVQVSAGGGTDNRLYLYDGTGADVVDITTDTATRDWSTGESVSTDGFERVYAYGDAGDTVSMMGDAAGSNWLYGYADHTILSCSSLFSQVNGFDSISVTAGGGIDNRIYMYDTDGADTFTFNQTSLTAELAPTVGTPIQIDADGFDLMRVYGTSGTGDVAYLNGTTGDDTFLGYDDLGYLTDTSGSDYYNYVRSVDEVHVDSGDSEDGNDDLNVIGTLAYNLLTYGTW